MVAKNPTMQVLFSAEQIAARVRELGERITHDFQGEPLVIVGVLKGSFIFLADLIRHISLPTRVEFVGVSSYVGTESTGHVRITLDLNADIYKKNVLLVEDIVDTGTTIDYLRNTLKVREPKDLRVCTLLSKPAAHKMPQHLDYIGFEIQKEYVVGYGFDLNGDYRGFKDIMQIIG